VHCTEWHLATQILYITGAALLLFAELFARAQLCCDERKGVYWALSVFVLASGKLRNYRYAIVIIVVVVVVSHL